MTSRENHLPESESRAAEFVARLYLGRMTDADLQSLEDWLAECEQHRQDYQTALDAWNRLEEVGQSRAVELEALVRPTSAHRRRRVLPVRRSWGIAIAASLLLVLSVFFITHSDKPKIQPPKVVRYATAVGEQKTVELVDGSKITLNTGSQVLVYYTPTDRRTVLELGEAYFDVTGDPVRPFSVDTGSRTVTVLGTQFNVQKIGLQLEVAVVEGEVVIHRPQDQITRADGMDVLSPNKANRQADQYRIPAGIVARFVGELGSEFADIQVSRIDDTGGYPKWRLGVVRFNNQPLYEIVKELNRYTSKKILIQDRRVMDLKISGVFKISEIDAALSRFETLFPLRITHYPDSVVIEGR